ncbi:hypothetical protein DIPPA_23540 [Diplonema papillatum]|nr:hypothetical protein DIPPA_23540 [Diplonema papillatum]|eukprot:gene17847-27506_t
MGPEIVEGDEPATTFPYAVCVLNVHGCLNAGAIMRTAHLCGCRKVVVFGRRKYDKRSAVGAQHYIEVDRVDGMAKDLGKLAKEVLDEEDYELNAEAFFRYMDESLQFPIFVEQSRHSIELTDENVTRILQHESDPRRTPCFVFGNEQFGVPENILALRERFPIVYSLELRQMGALESFNVSSCAAIVLYRVMECFSKFRSVSAVTSRNELRGRNKDAAAVPEVES